MSPKVPGAGSESPRSRFFQTMVVMGSSLALGCGGQAETDGGEDAAADPTSDAGGSGSDASSSAPITTSGSGSNGGGSGGSQASDVGGSGGSGGSGSSLSDPVEPGPFDCATEQLACSAADCANEESHLLPEGCVCDETRPTSADDCAPEETMVCLIASGRWDGRTFAREIPFQCTCGPAGENCVACGALGGDYRPCLEPKPDVLVDPTAVLCGCSVTLLR